MDADQVVYCIECGEQSLLSKGVCGCGARLFPGEPKSTTRKCPECAEEILAEAKKCKHCGSSIGAAAKPTVTSALASPLTTLASILSLVSYSSSSAVYRSLECSSSARNTSCGIALALW